MGQLVKASVMLSCGYVGTKFEVKWPAAKHQWVMVHRLTPFCRCLFCFTAAEPVRAFLCAVPWRVQLWPFAQVTKLCAADLLAFLWLKTLNDQGRPSLPVAPATRPLFRFCHSFTLCRFAKV